MLLIASIAAGMLATIAVIAVLVRQGFRHGDVPAEVTVHARTLAAAVPGCGGRWVQVIISNPSAATALVALGLRRVRTAWPGATAERRTAGRRAELSLSDRVLGAVPAGDSAEFHLWAEGDRRRLRLLVAVGTPGRLRLHRIPLPPPLTTAGEANPEPTSAAEVDGAGNSGR